MKYITLFFTLFMILSCSVKPDTENFNQTNRYIILTPSVEKIANQPLNQAIKISLPIARKFLYTDNIAYMEEDGSFGFYQYHKWDESPAKQLQFILADSLRQSGLFEDVILSPSKIQNELILESKIDSFYYIYGKKISQVKITLTLYLVDAFSKEILKSRYFNVTKNVDKKSPKAVVQGFHEATNTLIAQITHWLKD